MKKTYYITIAIIALILGVVFSKCKKENISKYTLSYAGFPNDDNPDEFINDNNNYEIFSDDITENNNNFRKPRKSHRSVLFPPKAENRDNVQTLPNDDYDYILFIIAGLLTVYYVIKKRKQ